jgi:iron(III) transport system substrate-binding protein
MNELTGGGELWTAMVANAPHPNAAKLFLNFALSEAGQLAACKNLCSSVVNTPGTYPFPPQYASPPIGEANTKRAELLSLVGLQ